jgi:hypothetical protein
MLSVAATAIACFVCVAATTDKETPHSWYDADLNGYRLPLANLGKPPAMITETEYYRLPENNLKTYPVYTPQAEPPGYLDRLK